MPPNDERVIERDIISQLQTTPNRHRKRGVKKEGLIFMSGEWQDMA